MLQALATQRGPGHPDQNLLRGAARRNPLIMKLEGGADLTDDDRRTLRTLTSTTRRVDKHRDIIREGDEPADVHVVMSGFAYRYKSLANGKRQILAYLVPGDFCDLHIAILGRMDHSIATLSPCEIVDLPRTVIEDISANHPRITRALWWATLVDEGTLREWLINLGRRPADQRIAHLFCELHRRLTSVGLVIGHTFELPLTQQELGESTSLSTVHVNRTLQLLRGRGLIAFRAGTLTILDIEGLSAFSEFNPDYLHLDAGGRHDGRDAKSASDCRI